MEGLRWDRLFGTVAHILNTRALQARLETLFEVVEALSEWGMNQMVKNPKGMKYTILQFMPDPKSSYDLPWLTSQSLFSSENSFAWRFTVNDARSRTLKGRNPAIYSAIDLRNLGMSGLPGSTERTGHPELDYSKADPTAEEEEVVTDVNGISLDMKTVNGCCLNGVK
eukprot:7724828-Lingulodinium_polyedra.AAC.1